ncbi:protein of unknown function [Bartonella clarridgeiae 73]|uniref:Uncharacterized protein n=1 Tax=Bartonella clarridgeiae (strain CCUG 45776 / CIP 104772 / 73) TaxID=696125 RepID=E6YGN6_BARC7|nr:protein of unknown function [Bartonella clarridgeiae 73]
MCLLITLLPKQKKGSVNFLLSLVFYILEVLQISIQLSLNNCKNKSSYRKSLKKYFSEIKKSRTFVRQI